MKKTVIFDFDYTLGDSTMGIVLSTNEALERLGYEPQDTEVIKKTIGLSLKESFFLLTKCMDLEKAEKYAEYFREKADLVMVEHTQLYEGVKEILQLLKNKNFSTAIVTTKFRYRIEDIFRKFDALELIDLIVGGEDVKEEKPSPEGLLRAVEQLHRKKEEVLYVGDSLVDAKTAKRAGIDFAAVLTGTTSESEFETYPSVYVGQNVREIYEYVVSSHV